MQEGDLKDVAQLLEKLARSEKAEGDDEKWKEKFKDFCDSAMQLHKTRLTVGSRTATQSDGSFEKQEVLRARFDLYSIVEERLDDILRGYDNVVAEVAKELRQRREAIFAEVLGELATLTTTIPDDLISIASSELGEDANDLTEAPTMGGSAAFARARRKKASQHETASLSSSNAPSMSPSMTPSMCARKQSKRTASEKAILDASRSTSRMATLTVNNTAYDNAGSDCGGTQKDFSSATASVNPQTSCNQMKVYGTTNLHMRGGPATLGAGPQDFTLVRPELLSSHSYSTLHQGRIEEKKSGDTRQKTSAGCPVTLPGTELSLLQLRQIIRSIYDSKQQYDAQCDAQNVATTTMEQHLYQYLGARYEVKSAVQDWSGAIFRAVHKYAAANNDVAVFGKVVQNTLGESFPSVQDTCRETLNQLLMNVLADKHPSRTEQELKSIWLARTRSGFPLKECGEVIRYMYNESDADKLLVKLNYAAGTKVRSSKESQKDDLCPLKVFLQVVLCFQMSLTEAFLSEFVEKFKQVDTNRDGNLNYRELEDLVNEVGYIEELDGIPPGAVLLQARNTTLTQLRSFEKGATFSQCVDIFTALISARWGALNPA